MDAQGKERRLREILSDLGRVIVAFSGGVDSSYLAFLAHQVLGSEAFCVTGFSPAVSRYQRDLALSFAATYRLNHVVIETAELDDPNYASNPTDRCYFCKTELYTELGKLAKGWGVRAILDGSNADDVGDHRPGRRGASEQGVRSPLIEVGLSKSEIRELSRYWELSSADLPAMPCLSSRFPYGTAVSSERLRQVEQAEEFLRSLGFKEFRVRHHDDLARIEISPNELKRVLEPEMMAQIEDHLRRLGYQFVTLDLGGFRSGSLNRVLDRSPVVILDLPVLGSEKG